MSVISGWRTTPCGNETLPLFVALPATSNAGVIVLQEAFGVNTYIQRVARRFADAGYGAVAPDLFHRFRRRTIAYDDVSSALEQLAFLDRDQVVVEVAAAASFLRKVVNGGAVNAVGFCFGGSAAFLAAAKLSELASVVVYYGSEIGSDANDALHTLAPQISCPILMHVGTDDRLLPSEAVQRIESSLIDGNVEYALHLYDGAGHGFACDDRPALFHREAADAAWLGTMGFLAAQEPK